MQKRTLTLPDLIHLTGLSRQGVLDGLHAAMYRTPIALVVRERHPRKKQQFLYGLNVDMGMIDEYTSLMDRPVRPLDQSKQCTGKPVNSIDRSDPKAVQSVDSAPVQSVDSILKKGVKDNNRRRRQEELASEDADRRRDSGAEDSQALVRAALATLGVYASQIKRCLQGRPDLTVEEVETYGPPYLAARQREGKAKPVVFLVDLLAEGGSLIPRQRTERSGTARPSFKDQQQAAIDRMRRLDPTYPGDS